MADKTQIAVEGKAFIHRRLDTSKIFSDYFKDMLEEITVDSMLEDESNASTGKSSPGETFAHRVETMAGDVRRTVVEIMCNRATELATQMIMRDPECAIVKRKAELRHLEEGN